MTEVLVFVGLLLLSAFFSGSETAFFSLSKAQMRTLRSRTDPGAKRVVSLLDHPRQLLVGILVGNTVVNTAAASISAIAVNRIALAAGFNPTIALVLQIVTVTFVLIVAVEISPKVFALRNNESWAIRVSWLVRVLLFILWPLTRLLVGIVNGMAKMFGVEATRVLFSEEELRTLAEVSEEHGVLEEDEREMIHSIFEFGETEVSEIMVPRIDMAAIGEDASIDEAIELVRERGHSRIPVYRNDVDHIVGILYAKDLIGHNGNGSPSPTLPAVMREAFFVPESKRISLLLKEFQQHKVHMAIVVDEYGGTEGLVTLEDIIEEIVGEIHDEFDTEEVVLRRLDDGDFHVLAKMEASDFNRAIGEAIVPTEDDYETLGGFIFSLAGEVPSPGQTFLSEGWSFTVKAVEGNRVVSVRVHPPADVEEESSAEPTDRTMRGPA
ncbi:hemolysin family protein [bacterium]|nr:hemolysin family protein [bacterium]